MTAETVDALTEKGICLSDYSLPLSVAVAAGASRSAIYGGVNLCYTASVPPNETKAGTLPLRIEAEMGLDLAM